MLKNLILSVVFILKQFITVDMAEESEVSEELEDKFMPSSHRKALVALLGVVVIVVAGVYALNSGMLDTANDTNSTQPADTNSTEETNQKIGLSPSQIEGEIVDVNITDIKAEPASPRIAPADGIRFVNQAGVDVQFNFSRNIDTFELAADESIIIDPKAIVYYDVTPVDEDAEFRDISARINVQG